MLRFLCIVTCAFPLQTQYRGHCKILFKLENKLFVPDYCSDNGLNSTVVNRLGPGLNGRLLHNNSWNGKDNFFKHQGYFKEVWGYHEFVQYMVHCTIVHKNKLYTALILVKSAHCSPLKPTVYSVRVLQITAVRYSTLNLKCEK